MPPSGIVPVPPSCIVLVLMPVLVVVTVPPSGIMPVPPSGIMPAAVPVLVLAWRCGAGTHAARVTVRVGDGRPRLGGVCMPVSVGVTVAVLALLEAVAEYKLWGESEGEGEGAWATGVRGLGAWE
jgi:hypothetical protein